MRLIEYRYLVPGRDINFRLYALGDVHIGALNCAEVELIKLVKHIQKDPYAVWIGGGDYADAVILNDAARFDVNTLPNWMLTGNPQTIKERIGDILFAQRQRFVDIVSPIRDKCLGLIEGNHEFAIFKHHNRDHMSELCRMLDVPNLTDCAFLRLKFSRNVAYCKKQSVRKHGYPTSTCTVFICHGHGGGRTAGAEPTKLQRLAMDKDADIILTGHSHTYHILPPIVQLAVPHSGKLPEDPIVHEKHVANWGSFLYTYKTGASTYSSRENYPVRPMYTVETVISPWHTNRTQEFVRIQMNGIKL